MFSSFLLLLPEFALILLGIFLGKCLPVPAGTWKGIEKLVYYVLFPPLLFRSIVNADVTLAESTLYLAVSIGTMLAVVGISALVPTFLKASAVDHASVFQCGFRFNSYIGFAVVMSMFGEKGLALMSLLIAIWVPISSFFAVAALAKSQANGSRIVKEVVTNPLIIATVSGLLVHSAGLPMPATLDLICARLGTSSLVLGLLAIGVGLKFDAIKSYAKLLSWAVLLRLVIVPTLALATVTLFKLPPVEAMTFLIFAMLPTANSCYILAVNMKGNGPLVAAVMTLQTLFAMVTMPVFLTLGGCLFS